MHLTACLLTKSPSHYLHLHPPDRSLYHHHTTMDSQILIVGAGVFGISTAYHLALQSTNPSSITILDWDPAPSPDAASTDVNKIIRADYSNSLYMRLGLEAIDAWKNSPLFKEKGVYHQTGWIMMNEKDSDLAERIRRNFTDITRYDPLEKMTEDEVRRNWGGVLKEADLSPFDSFFFNPLAGWADAGRALKIMADEAVRLGVRYQVGEASRLILDDNGVKGVGTKAGDVYTADNVLLCTGAWTSKLMAPLEAELNLPDDECIESQMTAAGVCATHVRLTEDERRIYDQLPVYVYGGQGKQIPLLIRRDVLTMSRRGPTSYRRRPIEIHDFQLLHQHSRDIGPSSDISPTTTPRRRKPRSDSVLSDNGPRSPEAGVFRNNRPPPAAHLGQSSRNRPLPRLLGCHHPRSTPSHHPAPASPVG